MIPGGGISPNKERWIHPKYPFLLPVKALAKVFRGKFVAGLRRAHHKKRLTCAGSIHHLAEPKYFAAFLRTLFRQNWVVYAKPAFGGPEQVLRYLGRYTHRVAISNHRLVSFDGERVNFRWRDYTGGNKMRTMTVTADEFIRRFLLHVLPKGFVRIRHFGVMANFQRSQSMALCTKLLDGDPPDPFSRKPPFKRNLAVLSMSHSHAPHRQANSSSTLLAILIGGFRELFVVAWPSEIFDALRHVLADVCLPIGISATAGRNPSSQLEYLRLKPAASPTAVRVPLSRTLHHATTSPRISVLSP